MLAFGGHLGLSLGLARRPVDSALQDGKGFFSAIIGPDGASNTVQRSNELLALKHTYVRCAVPASPVRARRRRRTGVGCVKTTGRTCARTAHAHNGRKRL